MRQKAITTYAALPYQNSTANYTVNGPVTTFFYGSGVQMQNVVTVYRILIYQKRHIFVQFLYQKIWNDVGYS